jgi:hypothetical protein
MDLTPTYVETYEAKFSNAHRVIVICSKFVTNFHISCLGGELFVKLQDVALWIDANQAACPALLIITTSKR